MGRMVVDLILIKLRRRQRYVDLVLFVLGFPLLGADGVFCWGSG